MKTNKSLNTNMASQSYLESRGAFVVPTSWWRNVASRVWRNWVALESTWNWNKAWNWGWNWKRSWSQAWRR
jgi:hypothetical protein